MPPAIVVQLSRSEQIQMRKQMRRLRLLCPLLHLHILLLLAQHRSPTEIADWLLCSRSPGGRPRTHDLRQIVNAILYVLRTGCHWRLLPHEYPNWKTVYDYFWKWRPRGLWQTINEILRKQVRRAVGRTALPSAGPFGKRQFS